MVDVINRMKSKCIVNYGFSDNLLCQILFEYCIIVVKVCFCFFSCIFVHFHAYCRFPVNKSCAFFPSPCMG